MRGKWIADEVSETKGASLKPESRIRARALRQNLTDAETILWSRLRRKQLRGLRFQRQYPVGPYIADFACREARLIVEIDGATHSSLDERAHDVRRTAYLESQGWTVIRFWNEDVYHNLVGVLESILKHTPPSSR